MSEKSEAEVLADALENLEATGWGGDCFALTEHSEQQAQLAAAKLRRLSAENETLKAQRDALLAALKEIVAATDSDEWNPVSTVKARAAIERVEEGK